MTRKKLTNKKRDWHFALGVLSLFNWPAINTHSLLYWSLPRCLYPAVTHCKCFHEQYYKYRIQNTDNIQTSAGEHPSNTREYQTPHHRPAKTYFQRFLATPTNSWQWNSSPSGSELHCPLSVGVARNSWKHRLCWPVVWRLSQLTSGEIPMVFSQQVLQICRRQIQYRLNRNIVTPWCTHTRCFYFWNYYFIFYSVLYSIFGTITTTTNPTHRFRASKTVWREIINLHLWLNLQPGAGSWLA